MIRTTTICDRCKFEDDDRLQPEERRDFFCVGITASVANLMFETSRTKSSYQPHIPVQLFCEKCCLELGVVVPVSVKEPEIQPEQVVPTLENQLLTLLCAFVQENSQQ